MYSYILIEATEGIIILAAMFATQDYRPKITDDSGSNILTI
jgi:hypothetical protein